MQTKHIVAKVTDKETKKTKVVGEKDIQLAENLAECVAIAGSEAAAVKMFNERYVIVEQNKLRGPADRPAGKEKLMRAAFKLLTQEEAQRLYASGDMEQMKAFLTGEEMQKRVAEAVAAGQITL